MDKKIFKGFKQVTSAAFNAAKDSNELSGYLWFVRTEVVSDGEETNDVSNDEYDIYFGARKYGHFCEGELPGIKSRIEALNGDVTEILSALDSLTSVVESNTSSIGALQSTISEYLIKNVDSNDKVLTVADGIISSQVGIVYENGYIKLTGKNHSIDNPNVIAEFDASAFIKDSVLEDVEVVTKENDEKYIVFTWKTEGDTTKTDEIKVSDFAKFYLAGNAIELAEDGVTFNVKVASENNFLSVNGNNELIVDDMTIDKTLLKESITIEGGPLASEEVKNAFNGGVIPAGTDVQSVLKALLCVEIYPVPTKNTPTYSVSISKPSVTSTGLSNGSLVEVGQKISFNGVSATSVKINKTEPIVSGFKHGYSVTIDGDINNSTSISGSWTITQMENNGYKLSAIATGFTGELPEDVTNVSAAECTLGSCELTAVEGSNVYKVTEDAPKHTGSHDGVDSYYIVSNLGGRSEDKKSVSIEAQSNVEVDPSDQSGQFEVIGVYPVFTNGVSAGVTSENKPSGSNISSPTENTKLGLMVADTVFCVSFASQGLAPYILYLPGDWKVKTAYCTNPLTGKYETDCKSNFVSAGTVERTIQGNVVTYTIYQWNGTQGADFVKFTVG